MSQTKFTPGPWEVEYDNSFSGQFYEAGPAKIYFAYNERNEVPLANAHLIAAAPDLYEALVFCRSAIESQGMFDLSERMAFDKATEALKKANP